MPVSLANCAWLILKKTGSKLGEPFRYGPTYGEWRKQQGTNLAEWQQPKK